MNKMIRIVRVIGHKMIATAPRIRKPKSDSVKAVPAPTATLAMAGAADIGAL
jgi:hypothetical protein